MRQLSPQNLPQKARVFSYDRDALDIGIVHFGLGNFHRAHQAIYVEDLLDKGETKWGIAGVSMRSASMKDALQPQDNIYALAILGEQTDYRIIGAIIDVLVAPETPQAIINLLANPTTQLVSSTITEKGYYLSSGQVDFAHQALKAELESLAIPTTIYGFLACGLIQRYQNAPTSKLTIMCCDNISSGGELIESGVSSLLERHHIDALAWTQSHVSFISSMVDRVSPATDDELREAVLRDIDHLDTAPVSAEPFTQWIIENNFAGERPNFDYVGAVFVDDIAPFEHMKLRYLNAAHTIVSTLGYLFKTRFVHEALDHPDIFTFMRQALYENVLLNADVPKGYDGAAYIEDVVKRFQNGNLPYANLQVGTDSSQKIQQRWFPTIDDALANENDVSYFAFCLAAWAVFIESAIENGVLNDPKKTEFEQAVTTSTDENTSIFLKIANAKQYNFYDQPNFMAAVLSYAQGIKSDGIEVALQTFLSKRA